MPWIAAIPNSQAEAPPLDLAPGVRPNTAERWMWRRFDVYSGVHYEWNGTAFVPCTLEGEWDGTVIQPLDGLLGEFDGLTIMRMEAP